MTWCQEKLSLVLLQLLLLSTRIFQRTRKAERTVCPSSTGSRAVTALTFNVSSRMAGTQNLPGRARHCSKAGDSVRPRDLLETSICLTRADRREGLQSDLRKICQGKAEIRNTISEQYLHINIHILAKGECVRRIIKCKQNPSTHSLSLAQASKHLQHLERD